MIEPSESFASEDLGMFEAAVHAPHLDLGRPALETVVVIPDGSNQDATARALAAAIAGRAGACVSEHTGLRTAAEIFAVCVEQQANLLVVPVPFGHDITELRDESLGSVVDMLLVESDFPVLCVRDLLDEAGVEAALADVLVPVNLLDQECARAASWAFRLLKQGGTLELLAVADRDVLDEARKLLGDTIAPEALRAEALNRAVTRDIGSLVAAVQKQGTEAGVSVHVEVKVGRAVQVELEEANARPRLIVAGVPKDHNAPAYHRTADLVLGAKGPVLVV